MADSAREAILEAAKAALTGASKPAGLTVHRFRTKPIEQDALPAMVVFTRQESVGKMGARSYGTKRTLRFTVECRVLVPAETAPDEALDPYVQWAVSSLMADQSLGGTCNEVEEVDTEWDAVSENKTYGAARITFEVLYYTRTSDLTARIG